MPPFKIYADHVPTGDQPTAIDHLVEGIRAGEPHITLHGATGTGKTFTIANVVERVQRPTIVMAPNKSLAAQLANEFREAFPENAVEYFVSYYDYYQPEAYVPSTDTYIEKDSSINDEIERLRHSATAALLTRRDVLIVASVSCIYGLGSPEEYEGQILRVHKGVATDMEWSKQRLVDIQYLRNQANLARGKFRVQGDVLEVHPSYEETAVRIEWWGDTIERITRFDPITGEVLGDLTEITVFPASHYVASDERMKRAVVSIEEELHDRLALLESQSKLLEAERLRMRTTYDLEMLREVGFCSGIDEFAHTPWTERLSDLLLASAARSMRIVSTLDIFSFGDVTPELRTACDNLVRFREAGGTVVYGTDLGNGAIPAGIHVREALLLHEAVRMTPEKVLVAMTAGPLAIGGPADLIVLGSDPLMRLEALGDLRVVVRAGRVVSG